MEFKDNPDVLNSMRLCLVFMAKITNVKLEHPPNDYDMETMLKMMSEMEHLPIYRSPKEKLVKFKDDVIIFFANIAMWIIRGFVSFLARVGYAPAKVEIVKIRKTHDKLRKET